MLLFSIFSYDDLLVSAGSAGDMSLLQMLSGLGSHGFSGKCGWSGLPDLSLSAHGDSNGDYTW